MADALFMGYSVPSQPNSGIATIDVDAPLQSVIIDRTVGYGDAQEPTRVSAVVDSGATLTIQTEGVLRLDPGTVTAGGTGWDVSSPTLADNNSDLALTMAVTPPSILTAVMTASQLKLTFDLPVDIGSPVISGSGTGWDFTGGTQGTAAVLNLAIVDLLPELVSATANTGALSLVFSEPVSPGTPTLTNPGANVPTLDGVSVVSSTAFDIDWTPPAPTPSGGTTVVLRPQYIRASTTMKKPQKVQFPDQKLSRFQDQVHNALAPLLDLPLSDSVLLKGIVLASGDNSINHGLGRQPQGWMVVSQSAAATFYDKQAGNPRPDQTLALNASADCTISLIVF